MPVPFVRNLIFAGSLCLTACAVPRGQNQGLMPGRYTETLTSGGFERKFIVRVPKSYDPSRKTPVVIVLHGYTGSASIAESYTRMGPQAEKSGFIAIFCDGLGRPQGWNAGFINLTGEQNVDDVKFVSDTLDWIEQHGNIDRKREYVCGHSNGAFLTNLVGAKIGSRLGAIASVAGTIGVGKMTIPKPTHPLSVLLIHGKADPTVAYGPDSQVLLKSIGAEESAAWWAEANGCRKSPQITKSGHDNLVTRTYTNGRDGTEVKLITIVNGLHNWPSMQRLRNNTGLSGSEDGLEASDAIWDFFQKHPKRS